MADEVPMMGMMANEGEVKRREGKEAIADFLRRKTLYDVMRSSGKVGRRSSWCSQPLPSHVSASLAQVVVFDTNIPIQLAFYALLEHGASCPVGCFPTSLSALTPLLTLRPLWEPRDYLAGATMRFPP